MILEEQVTKRRDECPEIFEGSPSVKSGNILPQPAAGRSQNITASLGTRTYSQGKTAF